MLEYIKQVDFCLACVFSCVICGHVPAHVDQRGTIICIGGGKAESRGVIEPSRAEF